MSSKFRSFKSWMVLALVAGSVMGTAFAKEKVNAEPPLEIKGNMPLMRILLTGEWTLPNALQRACPGAPDSDAVAKCLQAELEAAENGKTFINMFGGMLPTELGSKGNHSGAKKGAKVTGWVFLGIITGGIAPLIGCDNGCAQVEHINKYRMTEFRTSAATFKAVETEGHIYFVGKKILDSKAYPIIFITTN